MAPSPRQLARLVGGTGARARTLGLWECPRCLSRYVQPLDWEALPSGRVTLDLRCPECFTCRSGTFAADQVRELDRTLVHGRSDLRAVYLRTVRDNMYRELESFKRALELDLIDAADFGRRRQPRCSAYQA